MKRGATCLLATMLLVATGCGARLTQSQRDAALGGLVQGGATTGNTTAGTTGSTTTGGTTGTTGTTGSTIGTTGTTGSSTGVSSGPTCTGGGATDIGVTTNQITLATVSDVSGVQPGLFRSTWQAMQAFAAYANSQGGICGRTVKNLLLDSQADSTQNRATAVQACSQAFAQVGSMSAFDDGGASVGQQCGIPDVSAITINAPRSLASNTYPAYPQRPDFFNTSWALQIKQRYPDAIKKSALIYLNAGATAAVGAQRTKALTALGYTFVYKAAAGIVEANYGPYVQAMKQKGVELINMASDYQSIVRMQKAMQQANWFPEIRLWDSVAYSPNYLLQGGTAVDTQPPGCNDVLKNVPCIAYVFLDTSLFAEASSSPEMQLYEQWLQRVAPGAQPDYFGIYAWSAGRLFQKVATTVGAKLTRQAFFAAIKQIHSWNDFGMHAAHDTGSKHEANCSLYVQIKNDQFVRDFPSTGWTCTGQLMPT